jgi:hypothetical protein
MKTDTITLHFCQNTLHVLLLEALTGGTELCCGAGCHSTALFTTTISTYEDNECDSLDRSVCARHLFEMINSLQSKMI